MSVIAQPIMGAQLLTMIQDDVKDLSGVLTATDYDTALSSALARYSKDRPRLVVSDIAGTNSRDYPVPAAWVDGLSTVERVEYPANQIPEILLDDDGWSIYRSPSGLKFRLTECIPAVGEIIRLLFSTAHDSTTVPDLDTPAVASLAASTCCRRLAQIYGQTSDPTIQADSVNYRSKGDEYARRAKELEGLYRSHIGVKENDTTPAACATVRAPDNRRSRLTHR